jgi:oxygen-independent coproporphyrinogen-3 oxidase
MIAFDTSLLRRFDQRGPRYTSYPTADRFESSFGAHEYRRAFSRRGFGSLVRPLGLYVHLPFCRNLCFYCACNRIVTRDESKASRYLGYLGREIELQAALCAGENRVIRMHWGGGTPTFHAIGDLRALWGAIAARFELDPEGDYSIEVDPRTAAPDLIASLRSLGFNRVSFGVQDFDPAVQAAINRIQSEEGTLALIAAARAQGYRSINVDLVYGLPRQNELSFARTIARVLHAEPDRIALYNYAHLPSAFKAQRKIRDEELPSAEARLDLFGYALKRFEESGYVHIGMDHFARPDDALAVAQRQGYLHRDFQGYSAGGECDLIGFGVSAIGAIGATYSQNQRRLSDYYRLLDCCEPPILRGIELKSDDLVRRAVIQALMCNFSLCKSSIGAAHLIDFDRYFASELIELRRFADLGLITDEADWLTITSSGRMLVRNVCMVFDRHLREKSEAQRYSRVV